MIETCIYVGLNDSKTLKQEHVTSQYISVLKNVCKSYHIPFSFYLSQGGYLHEDGRYTEENSLKLTLMDVPEQTVTELAKDLCAFFHQESVMVTFAPTKVVFIKETI